MSQASSDNVLPESAMTFIKGRSYIRQLSPKELREPTIIRMIQESEDLIGEVYAVFDSDGKLQGAGSERSLAAEAAEEHNLKPQVWLI